jgi:DNA polymerase-3 subunit delta
MKNYDEVQILILLANQFRFLYQVKRLLNKNKRYDEIAKILEVNPYRVKFTIKKLYTYTEDMLLDNIRRLAKIDHDIKLGIMNKRLALELFMIKR